MKDVSVNDGRTVLFMSHNIAAVRGLWSKGLLMSKGQVELFDNTSSVIDKYLSTNTDEVNGIREGA